MWLFYLQAACLLLPIHQMTMMDPLLDGDDYGGDQLLTLDSFWRSSHHPVMMDHDFGPSMMNPFFDDDMKMSEEDGLMPMAHEAQYHLSSYGKASDDIPEDVIDGIVAKVLVDEKLNPIFNPKRRFKSYRGRNKSGYRKHGRRRNHGNPSVKPKELDHGLQYLSKYVKELRQANWKGEEAYEGNESRQEKNKDKSSKGSDFKPIFATKYKKNDDLYNVYGFLVPMASNGKEVKAVRTQPRKPCHLTY